MQRKSFSNLTAVKEGSAIELETDENIYHTNLSQKTINNYRQKVKL